METMRHVLRLRLLSLRAKGGLLSFLDHLEQAEDWADVLVVDIQLSEGAPPRTWARWGSGSRSRCATGLPTLPRTHP